MVVGEQELAHVPNAELAMVREPAAVIAEARKAAQALKDIVASKPKKVMMNGEQYLEFEDWQTLAKFYGLAAKVVAGSSRVVQVGDALGFEATAVVVDTRTGVEISAAEAMCLNDEEKWSARPKYEWHYVKKSGGLSKEDPGKEELIWEDKDGKRLPKRERVQAGTDPVPMFQLRSMAQTRACAKALRNVLAWVVVLAGYKPTPAEELDNMAHTQEAGTATVPQPQRASETGSAKEYPQTEAHTKLWDELLQWSGGDEENARAKLQELTTWSKNGTTHAGKLDVKFISEKMAQIALAQFKKGPAGG